MTRIVVNGDTRDIAADPPRSLLHVLREELGLTGPKYGCGEGACGACTVLVDGAVTRACVTGLDEVAGRTVTTVEGLAVGGVLHLVQQAFVAEAAFADGRVANAAQSEYPVPRFHDLPPIEVVLLNRPDLPSAGAGETPIVALAPAIANAIFAASGVRLRSLPLVPDGRVPNPA